VLPAQELMTLFPYGTNGAAAIAATKGIVPMEPCVLLREPGGWWGYHHGHDLQCLINSLSSTIVCERILKECLVDRISFTRRLLLSGTLRIKSAQQEWIDRRIRSERWTSQVRLSEDFTVAQAIRLVEVVWARCVEVRMYIHYSGIYRREEDPSTKTSVRAERDAIARRQKRIRETLQDDTFDHHPIKGWSRIDLLTRLRELGATTTATRIHADSSVFGIVNHNLKHSIFHRREQPVLAAPAPVVVTTSDVVSAVVLEAKPAEVTTVSDSTAPSQQQQQQQQQPDDSHLLEDMEDFLNLAEALADPVDEAATTQDKAQSQPMEEEEEEEVVLTAESRKPNNVESTLTNISLLDQQREEEEDARLQRVAENSDRYDPEIEAALEMSYNNTKKQMPVEQLHLVTGEVLRVYPRGKDAALFMNVSQSGISLCCSGTKADCYGFRWRMYEGPPIDCECGSFVYPFHSNSLILLLSRRHQGPTDTLGGLETHADYAWQARRVQPRRGTGAHPSRPHRRHWHAQEDLQHKEQWCQYQCSDTCFHGRWRARRAQCRQSSLRVHCIHFDPQDHFAAYPRRGAHQHDQLCQLQYAKRRLKQVPAHSDDIERDGIGAHAAS
jgi:hypothetical protein